LAFGCGLNEILACGCGLNELLACGYGLNEILVCGCGLNEFAGAFQELVGPTVWAFLVLRTCGRLLACS
ncbi:MAG: hypothetical protein KDA47_14425, partial [Planctomycetales bacterium]|nr:hypothetical protein [Planctomycetales bacterium]